MWLEWKRHVTAKRKSSIQAEKEGHSCYSPKKRSTLLLGLKKNLIMYHIIVTLLEKNAQKQNASFLRGFLSFIFSVTEIKLTYNIALFLGIQHNGLMYVVL